MLSSIYTNAIKQGRDDKYLNVPLCSNICKSNGKLR